MGLGVNIGLAAAALAASALALPCMAGDAKTPVGVVELFTSQGCSSCPPADTLFESFAARDDVVALAYHVDYWDYLGWNDTLASKESTERQYGYMRTFGNRSVYTPQAVVNGRVDASGADKGAIETALADLGEAGKGLTVPISVRQAGDSVVIETGESSGHIEKAHVLLVHYAPRTPIKISRGENKGRTITYWNAVTGVQTAGMWHGAVARFEMPLAAIKRVGKGGCAVLLQSVGADGRPGPILGAAVIEPNASKL